MNAVSAAKLRQCSRRFPVAIHLRSLGVLNRLDRVGGSDGVFKFKWGYETGWERAPRGRSSMLSRSRYSGDGHASNSMSDMQLGSLWGGGRIFGRGFAKRGVRTNPPNPPWLRACGGTYASTMIRLKRHSYASNDIGGLRV